MNACGAPPNRPDRNPFVNVIHDTGRIDDESLAIKVDRAFREVSGGERTAGDFAVLNSQGSDFDRCLSLELAKADVPAFKGFPILNGHLVQLAVGVVSEHKRRKVRAAAPIHDRHSRAGADEANSRVRDRNILEVRSVIALDHDHGFGACRHHGNRALDRGEASGGTAVIDAKLKRRLGFRDRWHTQENDQTHARYRRDARREAWRRSAGLVAYHRTSELGKAV